MICKCPTCKEFCSGTTNTISSAGINTVNKVTDSIENLKKQMISSTPLIRGVGKVIIDSASTIFDWDTYYWFECSNCGEKWNLKESDAVDETDEYFTSRAIQFSEIKGERVLTINPDADCICPKDSSVTLLRSVPKGITSPDNKFQKGIIYISHPADNSIFYPSTTYRYDVMKDELDDIIVFLQKLGAKRIRIKGKEQTESKSGMQSIIKTAIGIQSVDQSEVGISNSSTTQNSNFNRLSRMYSKEIKSELLHLPVIDNALLAKWSPIRKEWSAILEMRKHGIIEYDFEISSTSITSSDNAQIDRIEADYRELCVKTSVSVSREVIRSLREETHLGFIIHVEFYSESEYERFKSPKGNATTLLKKLFKL